MQADAVVRATYLLPGDVWCDDTDEPVLEDRRENFTGPFPLSAIKIITIRFLDARQGRVPKFPSELHSAFLFINPAHGHALLLHARLRRCGVV